MNVFLAGAIAAFGVMVVTWLISLPVRDASLADIAWGLVFVAVAWAVYAAGERSDASLLVAILVSIWGLRLSGYLAWRNLGHGEDRRYQAMRAKRPATFWLWSLVGVFFLQAAIGWVVSLPVQSLGAQIDALSILSWVGVAGFVIGIGFEATGDAQLAAFKRDPSSKGKVMDRGLWRYTRHPNYFGDAVVWWSLWLVAVGAGAAWWTLIGPALMTLFLVRVSGAALLESDIADRRPGYADYIRRTSSFVPLPPKKDQ